MVSDGEGVPETGEAGNKGVEGRRTEPQQRTPMDKQAVRRGAGQAAGPKARLAGVGVLCCLDGGDWGGFVRSQKI